MLNRIHDIRESATRFLGDLIDPAMAIRPDPQRLSNFVEGHAQIVTTHNTYRLSVFSPQAAQPRGAPAECASLGSVVFHDPVNDLTIMGSRSDRTFLDISRHVHAREYTDRIAHARRDLAEAGPEATKAAQEKLGALVSAAAQWGVSGSVPMAPPTKSVAPPAATSAPAPATESLPGARDIAMQTAASVPTVSGPEPMIGLPIIFLHNPGEGSAGMTTVPATVTRVWHSGEIGLQMFVDDHDVQHRPKVHRRGADAGNGRVHTHGCWDLAPWYAALISRLDALEQSLAAIDSLAAENKQLSDRLAALESAAAKPRRGRLARAEGCSEAEAAELAGEGEPAASGQPTAKDPDLVSSAQ